MIDVTTFSDGENVSVKAQKGLASRICPVCGGKMRKFKAPEGIINPECFNPDCGPWICKECGQVVIGIGDDTEIIPK